MVCFVMRRPACWSWFFELRCIVHVDCCGLSTIVIKTIIIIIILIMKSLSGGCHGWYGVRVNDVLCLSDEPGNLFPASAMMASL